MVETCLTHATQLRKKLREHLAAVYPDLLKKSKMNPHASTHHAGLF